MKTDAINSRDARTLLARFRSSKGLQGQICSALVITIAAPCITFLGGCDTAEGSRALGTGIGAVGGAIAGGFINRRNPVAGVLAGAAIGGSAGYMLGQTKLFKSRQLKFQEGVLKGNVAEANRYADRKFVNVPIKGFPPAYYAAIRGDSAMVRFLARTGADLGYHTQGKTLAFVAAAAGHRETGETLVSLGGGSHREVEDGRSFYLANQARQREQNRAACALALAFVAAAITSNASSSGDSWWDGEHGAENRYYDPMGAAMHDTNRQIFGPVFGN